jgi:hypothetical protein
MNLRMPRAIFVGVWTLCLTANASSAADIVRANLRVWLDAGDHNADGAQELGSGKLWRNKANTGAVHDASLAVGGEGPAPTWSGNGTPTSPFAVQFRFIGKNDGGYAVIANSAAGSDLDAVVFTYEIWARRNGIGGNGLAHFGALITHSAPAVGGNGGINYTHGPDGQTPARALFDESGGKAPIDTPLPKSAGVFSAAGYHHFVFARAGDGTQDSAFYVDGVLLGRFKTESTKDGTEDAPVCLGGRSFSPKSPADYFLDCDIAIARIYAAALADADVTQNYSAEAARFGRAKSADRAGN